ncbi:MAG: hypothetical protein QM791_13780 [Ferruginibacter sp.]
MKKFFKKNAGIIIGAVYALMLRFIFNIHGINEAFSLFSVTFIWLTPIIIGLIPLFYATDEQIKRWGFRISSPVYTVAVFFILCFLTRLEDLLCLWIILIPYMLSALISGIIAGAIIQKMRRKKATFLTILILPFVICPIEQQFPDTGNSYTVTTSVIINATPQTIWQNIIRVKPISEAEYKKGFFNYAGIPRPLDAALDKDTVRAKRVGHFEGGLQFIETVKYWERNRHIGFDIVVVPSSIRQAIFDQHILRGNHFKFLDAGYTLKSQPGGQTELILSSSYQLNSKINAYASYCGNLLLADFQERLLDVIKARCER